LVSDIPAGDGKIRNLFFSVPNPLRKRVHAATYNFVCCVGKLIPENFPAVQFLKKADKYFVTG
jgi:hypothetical protein